MRILKNGLFTFAALVVFTGIIYPLIVTLIAQSFFPFQANGSIIKINHQIIGSELIGQNFSNNKYLWPRPSATSDYPYNALMSGASNLGPTNIKLYMNMLDYENKLNASKISNVPIDLVTSSASGLDPEISIAAAYYQIQRIAMARDVSPTIVKQIIDANAKYPQFKFLGEPRVNVLLVNLALDSLNYSK
ncbi:MAG: potassium-transporting ATPase subunit KdpC [Burkholderiales bacterium]|nr:potassium-transporting ATPase subunit KdpC [Burkholderiales bacterium]